MEPIQMEEDAPWTILRAMSTGVKPHLCRPRERADRLSLDIHCVWSTDNTAGTEKWISRQTRLPRSLFPSTRQSELKRRCEGAERGAVSIPSAGPD